MNAKRAYRRREEVQVAVLDALVDRGEEGMSVLELRAAVDADIDAIEEALTNLKRDDLISVVGEEGNTVIKPDERVMPDPEEDEEPDPSIVDWLRDRLPF